MYMREKYYKKKAKETAAAFLREKRGYVTAEEKRAFKLAVKLRRQYWRESLNALDADERNAQLRAYRIFRLKVFFGGLFAKKPKKQKNVQKSENGQTE